MTLFDDLFYSGPMLAVFSDESRLQRMLDFESALASAEAEVGLIPADAASIIAEACRVEVPNIVTAMQGAAQSGNLAIPLIKQLTAAVTSKNAAAAGYVHWGATSQDVIDTGLVLQIRDAFMLIAAQLHALATILAALAEHDDETLMPGRTWLQHAVPITFGLKAAGWLDAVLRHQTRLHEVRERALTLQFGGAAGTLASLGPDGQAVSQALASSLDLVHADISWHTTRDRFAEVSTLLGLITASLGKIARDVSLMMQTEVAEAFEGAAEGRGGSSTMPHKRNPVLCSAVLAAAVRVPNLVATVLTSMSQEHERGLGNWQSEWETIPELFNLCAGALEKTNELLAGLQLDRERMAANLNQTNGLLFAEAVSMALSKHIGKPAAHALVEQACRKAIREKQHLRIILQQDEEVRSMLSATQLQSLFSPACYLGVNRKSIDQVLARAEASGVETSRKWVSLPGVRIHYKMSGQPAQPVIVFSNSLGADLTMWNAQVAELSRHFRILTYDTRGHGHSETPPGPYSVEQLGHDVISLLDALNIENCAFCGLSMGGQVGQWLAINAPSRIHKLILSNTAARIGTADNWNTRIAAVQKEGFAPLIAGVLERWFTPAFHISHPKEITRIRKVLDSVDPVGYIACCASVRDADFRSDLMRISTPTLVFAGTHDPATPPSDARYLADNIAGAQLIELNASHISNIEAAPEFTDALLEFLLS